jgi:hypothetical protein
VACVHYPLRHPASFNLFGSYVGLFDPNGANA